MIFEQQQGRAEGYLHRPEGRSGIRSMCGHRNRCKDVAMFADDRRLLGIAVIRIITRWRRRFGGYGGCECFTEKLS